MWYVDNDCCSEEFFAEAGERTRKAKAERGRKKVFMIEAQITFSGISFFLSAF